MSIISRISAWGKRHKKGIVLSLSALLIAAIAGGITLYYTLTPSSGVLVTEVAQRGDIEKSVLATGVIKPSMQVNVGAQVNGRLTKLYVKQGDRVKKGQLLAEIDPTLQQSELRKSEAALKSAEAQQRSARVLLTQYELELKRQRRMARDGSGVKSELEKALSQYESQREQLEINEAQIVQSQMALETAKANLGYTQISAPIDGEVLGIVTKEGQTVVSSQTAPTILVLAELDTMTVHTRISETDILKVKVGQPLWFYVVADPRRRYDSTMGAIQEAPDEALQEQSSASSSQQSSAVYYNGVFSIDNTERLLKTSMTAQVFIITDRVENVIQIPVAALGRKLKGDDRYEVQVAVGDRVETRIIKTGINDRMYAEVKDGIREGEKVIISQNVARGPMNAR